MLFRGTYCRVNSEFEICERYGAELASIAALDRCYYVTPCPTRLERAMYARRQVQLAEARVRFYAELAACRLQHLLHPCPSILLQSPIRRRN
jgi:hypothetical protein